MDKELHKKYIYKYLESHKEIKPIKCPFCKGDLIGIWYEIPDDSFGFKIICINEECRHEWIDIDNPAY